MFYQVSQSILNALSIDNLLFISAISISQKIDILSVVPGKVKKSVPPPFEFTAKPINTSSKIFFHKKIHQFGHYRLLKIASYQLFPFWNNLHFGNNHWHVTDNLSHHLLPISGPNYKELRPDFFYHIYQLVGTTYVANIKSVTDF